MRKLLDQVGIRLRAFIEQRDDFTLVVRCGQPESAYILKLLQSLDEGGAPDIFWTFTEDFERPEQYISRVLLRFQEQHAVWSQALARESYAPWLPVPEHLLDARMPPVRRMQELMKFARSLLPEPEGRNLVWVLFPSRVTHPEQYARFVTELIRHELPGPWCHHMRLVLRDEPEHPLLERQLRQQPRLQWYAPDLSQQAMQRGFEEEAADESVSLPLRLQSLLVLAGLDQAHRRHAEAMEKYRLLLRYYLTTRNHTLSALVLNGMGEVCERQGAQKQAQSYFESALTPAIEGKAWPVLLNITLNLANLKHSQRQWREAEAYYDGAEKLATAQCISTVKIQCLENRGHCQHQQGRLEGALQDWSAAATLARKLSDQELLRQVLRRLKSLYAGAGLREHQRKVEQELASLEHVEQEAS